MAIIECPECGKKISDKARKCVHCGHTLLQESPKICPECGTQLNEEDIFCPSCGFPIAENINKTEVSAPQQVEVTGVKVNTQSKKIMAIAAGVVIAIIVAVWGIQYVQKQQAIKEAEQAEQDYKQNIISTSAMILSGAAEAENCGNLIKKVWYNAIYEDFDTETDPYTRSSGRFVDFNTALQNLFSDPDFSARINTIEENQVGVQEMMKELKNPPEGYQEAHTAITELYNAYLKLTNLVVSPQGNLQTFSENFNAADSETSNKYDNMKLHLE